MFFPSSLHCVLQRKVKGYLKPVCCAFGCSNIMKSQTELFSEPSNQAWIRCSFPRKKNDSAEDKFLQEKGFAIVYLCINVALSETATTIETRRFRSTKARTLRVFVRRRLRSLRMFCRRLSEEPLNYTTCFYIHHSPLLDGGEVKEAAHAFPIRVWMGNARVNKPQINNASGLITIHRNTKQPRR